MWKMHGVKNLQLYLVRQTTSPIGMWAVDDSGSSNGGGGDGSINTAIKLSLRMRTIFLMN